MPESREKSCLWRCTGLLFWLRLPDNAVQVTRQELISLSMAIATAGSGFNGLWA